MALVSILRRKNDETKLNTIMLTTIPVPDSSFVNKKKFLDRGTQYDFTQHLDYSRLNKKMKLNMKSTASVLTQCCLLPVVKTEPSVPIKTEPYLPVTTFKSTETQCCLRDNHTAILIPALIKPKTNEKSVQIDFKSRAAYPGNNPLLTQIYQVVLEDESYFSELHIEAETDYLGEEFIKITKLGFKGILGAKLDPITLTIGKNAECTLSILFKKADIRNVIDFNGELDTEKFKNILNYLLPSSLNSFCSGINLNLIENEKIHASMLRHDFPITRYQSKKCKVYYKVAKLNKFGIKQCVECKYATNCLTKARKRNVEEIEYDSDMM